MTKKIIAAALATLLVAGCAQMPGRSAAAPVAARQAAPLPSQSLTEPVLFDFLLASIADQRGNDTLAAAKFLELARQTRDPRLAERAADIALLSRQDARALEAALLWQQLRPRAREPKQMLAALYLENGQLDQARPFMQQSLATQRPEERNASFLMLNGLLARYADHKAARAFIDELAKPYPDNAAAQLARAQAAARNGQLSDALVLVRRARQLDPAMEAPVLAEAQILKLQHPAAVLPFYADYLKAHPKADNIRLAYARELAGTDQVAASRDQFRQLLAAHPGNPDVLLALGLLSMQLHDDAQAERDFKLALRYHYADAGAVKIYLGQLNEARKRYPEAMQWYRAVKSGDAQYTEAQFRIAGAMAAQGKLKDAQAYLHRVPAATPAARAQVALAASHLYRDANQNQAAYRVLDQALKSQPDNPELLYEHALAADQLNHLPVFERDLRRAIQLKPNYGQAYNALGYGLADKTKRYNEAQALITRALQMLPGDPMVLDSMGWVSYRLGHLKEAQGYLQRAYAGSQDPEIAAHLGEVMWVSGRHSQAQALWLKVLKDNPKDVVLRRTVKKFKVE